LFVLCFVLQTCLLTLAQTNAAQARKFDEFGDIQHSDLIARLDNFAVELQNQPGARGFLIVYRARRDLPGLSNRYALHMKDYLVHSRGISTERIATVDGGVSSCLTQELWIVPVGATPLPRNDAYFDSYRGEAFKFDEHYYSLPSDPGGAIYWSEAPDNLFVYLDAFAAALQKEPRSIGYLVAYKSRRDGAAVTQQMFRREKNFLIKEYGIKSSRIKMIDGGYRKWRWMELWIVPPGEDAPILAPSQILRNRRKR
jgi:hypothetical protein